MTGTTPIDEVCAALSAPRRRYVVRFLLEQDAAVQIEAVADVILERESDACRDAVTVSLSHHHLPRLADAGLVEYDASRGEVAFDSRPRTTSLVRSLVTACDAAEDGGTDL